MTVLRLTLKRDEENETQYVLERLNAHPDITAKLFRRKSVNIVQMTSESRCFFKIVKDIIASVITIFYKYRALTSAVAEGEEHYGMAHYAFLGALLSFDADIECLAVEKTLEEAESYSVSSVFEFRHAKLRESWENLASLANRLLGGCADEDELYEIISFLLAIDPKTAPKLRLEGYGAGVTLYAGHVVLPIPLLTDNREKDAAVAMMRERPGSIIIEHPKKIDPALFACIKKMGEDC